MNPATKQMAIGMCFVAILQSLTGCASNKDEASGTATPINAAAAVNDPRIPPAQKAALDQTIAQQKARAAEVDARMKAFAGRKP